jgi:CheY-like chemotaxis protein
MPGSPQDPSEGTPIRLLIIDDSNERIATLRQWLPADVHVVSATSAGRALKILDLDHGTVYAGILLDHDLGQQVVAEAEHGLTGLHVARRIVQRIARDAPVLVHSMSLAGGSSMQHLLEAAGFAVTRIRFEELTRERLLDWLEDVRAEWAARAQR